MIEGQEFKHLYIREETHVKIKQQAKRRGMTAINYIETLTNAASEVMAVADKQAAQKKEGGNGK